MRTAPMLPRLGKLSMNQRRELQVQAFDIENYFGAGMGTLPALRPRAEHPADAQHPIVGLRVGRGCGLR